MRCFYTWQGCSLEFTARSLARIPNAARNDDLPLPARPMAIANGLVVWFDVDFARRLPLGWQRQWNLQIDGKTGERWRTTATSFRRR